MNLRFSPQARLHLTFVLSSLLAAAGCRGMQGAESPQADNAPGAAVESVSQALAGTWTGVDIGATAPGSSSGSGSSFTVTGGGADIWTAVDAFRFHYMTVTGNVTLTAQVTSQQSTDAFAKAGVMMRENLTAGARNVMTVLTPTPANGYRFQSRVTADATTGKATSAVPQATPGWVRIVRSGSNFTSFFSLDGTSWTQIGAAVSIAMPSTIEVGLAVSSHNTSALSTVQFANVVFNPAQTPPSPPPAPGGLTAIPGNNQVALAWNTASGATSYTVKRSTVSGSGYTNLQTQSGTGYTDTTAVNGTTYYYVVSASNAAGSSANSPEASATPAPPAPPGPPGTLIANPGNAQVALTWTASTGTGVSYTVKRSNTPGEGYTNVQAGLTATSFTNTGLSNGTAYYYIVTASNSGGESAPSNEANATPQAPPPPGAPGSLIATAGNAQVALSWAASPGTGNTYTVKRSPSTTPRAFSNVQAGVTGTNYTNTGLTNGTTYVYVVTASNSGGESAPSNEASATPSAPPAPTWTQVNINGATPTGSFTVGTGSNPTHTVVGGGADFSSTGTTDQFKFVYQNITGDATITARVASLAAVSGQTFVKAGLMFRNGTAINAQYACVLTSTTATNGYRYQYRTTAGQAAAQIRQSGNSAVPGWLRVQRTGSVFTAFTSANGSTWTNVGSQTISMPASIQVGFAVTSHLQGTSTTAVYDNFSLTTPTPPTPPPAPTMFSAAGENNQAHLVWNPVAGATSYTIKQSASSSGPFTAVATAPAGSESDAVHYARTGLTNDTTYWFTVSASNSAGAGADTSPASATPQLLRPSVRSVGPADSATNVATTAFVSLDLVLPNLGGGVDVSTLSSASVNLVRASDSAPVTASANTSGGGDVIVLQPLSALDANTSYIFTLTSGARDLTGAPFMPFTSRFTTGAAGPPAPTNVSFTRVLATSLQKNWTSITVGPDSKVYAATVQGEIYRFSMASNGTLTSQQLISTITSNNGGARAIIGLRFDPAATASNLILWVTHGHSALKVADDWSGKLSRLSGANLTTYQDYVINFPRSYKDHMTNSLDFKSGETGIIYITQGSMNAMGAPDTAWGDRSEHLMSAAILRVDTTKITSPPLNIQTNDANPSSSGYNPFAANAPVTIYASGVRNAYDILWHSNGELYTSTNGSAAGGNTPATPGTLPSACTRRIDKATKGDYIGPSVPGITSNSIAEEDYFYRIIQGGYYGHPNPSRCEWVLNGGNPTSSTSDHNEVANYPVGVQPDRNYRGYTFNFGAHYSPNGMMEWKAPSVPSLMGKILVIRYSGGDDIIVLTVDPATKGIADSQTGITGFGGFIAPLDITHNVNNGDIYVTEHDTDTGGEHIYRLRPNP
jgi:fibronectin type 3 domain-containing protein/regulation of enolase protein 1 (concanavalin A-like superfamily)